MKKVIRILAVSLFAIVVVCFLRSSVFAQTAAPKCPEEIKYDRFKDATVEVCGQLFTKNDASGLFAITVNVQYQGQQRQSPITAKLIVISQQISPGRLVMPKYNDVSTLYLLTDTGRAELPVKNIPPSAMPARDMVIEGVIVELSSAALSILIDAKNAEGKLGTDEFKFEQAGLTAFQGLLRQLRPLLKLAVPSQSKQRRKLG